MEIHTIKNQALITESRWNLSLVPEHHGMRVLLPSSTCSIISRHISTSMKMWPSRQQSPSFHKTQFTCPSFQWGCRREWSVMSCCTYCFSLLSNISDPPGTSFSVFEESVLSHSDSSNKGGSDCLYLSMLWYQSVGTTPSINPKWPASLHDIPKHKCSYHPLIGVVVELYGSKFTLGSFSFKVAYFGVLHLWR
jgi:hypothetical protein